MSGFILTAMHVNSAVEYQKTSSDKTVATSVNKCKLIDRAMKVTGPCRDIEPRFDPTKGTPDQYLPVTALFKSGESSVEQHEKHSHDLRCYRGSWLC